MIATKPLRQLALSDTGCAAYAFGCATLGECAVVDPQARDLDTYAEFAAARGMRITHAIDTHVQRS